MRSLDKRRKNSEKNSEKTNGEQRGENVNVSRRNLVRRWVSLKSIKCKVLPRTKCYDYTGAENRAERGGVSIIFIVFHASLPARRKIIFFILFFIIYRIHKLINFETRYTIPVR